jgi:hypothetical protein
VAERNNNVLGRPHHVVKPTSSHFLSYYENLLPPSLWKRLMHEIRPKSIDAKLDKVCTNSHLALDFLLGAIDIALILIYFFY